MSQRTINTDSRAEGSFQISFIEDGETRVITLEGRREDYDFEYKDGELEIEAREGDFELEFEDVDSFEFQSMDPEKTAETSFQISFNEDGETRVITLQGRREDYDFEYEDGELEIEAREGDFELELGDVDSFEFRSLDPEKNPVGSGDNSPEAGRVTTLSGPLHDFDFLLQDGALAVRNRFDGEIESLSEFDSFVAGEETFQTADIMAQLEQAGPDLLAEGGPRLMMVNTPEATPSVIWDQILQSIIVESGGGPTNVSDVSACGTDLRFS